MGEGKGEGRAVRQLVNESLVYGISGVVTKFIGLLLLPVYTRIFAPDDYGVVSLVGTTLAAVSIVVVLALDGAAHRWFWETTDEADRKRTLASWSTCQLVLGLGCGSLIALGAPWLAQHIVGRSDADICFRLAAVTLPLSAFSTVTTNWLRMQRRPWATVSYALLTSLLNLAFAFVFVVVLQAGVPGVFAAQVVSGALGALVAVVLMRDWLSPRHFRLRRLGDMLRFAAPLIPASVTLWVLNFSDRYILQFYQSTSDVGLYQVGAAIASGVALVTGAFQQAWGPFSLSIHTQENAPQVYARVLLLYLWLTCGASSAIALFGPEIIGVFATKQYLGAGEVIGLLSFAYVMIGAGSIAATGPSIAKRMGSAGLAITFGAVLSLALNLLLVPRLGRVGSALSMLISQSVVPIYLFFRSQQVFPIPYRFGAAGVIVLVGAVVTTVGARLEAGSVGAVLVKVALLGAFVPLGFGVGLITREQLRRLLESRLRPA